MACIKELQLKLCECGKGFPKKDRQIIELVLMNLWIQYNMLCLLFQTNWQSHKEHGKDYSFDVICDLLIRDQQKLLDEWKLGHKQQAQLLKWKHKEAYKDRIHTYGSSPWQEYLDQKTKLKTEELLNSQKDRKKKTCRYYVKDGHVKKIC